MEKKLDKYLGEMVPPRPVWSPSEMTSDRKRAWKKAGYKDFVECCGTCKFRKSAISTNRVYDICVLPRNEKIVQDMESSLDVFDIHEMGVCSGYKKE